MPTTKAKKIDALLTSLTGISRQTAAQLNVCTWCKLPVTAFRDALSEKEYTISGFCQACQDGTFGSQR